MEKRILPILVSLALLFMTALLFNNCQPFETKVGLESENNDSNLPVISASQSYFNDVLNPTLENACAACHTAGGIAPLSIYDFDQVNLWMEQGESDSNNYLFNKMNAVIAHGGGDQCPQDDASPCLEVSTYSLLKDPLKTEGIAGQALEADALGRMKAWALDPLLPDEILEAHVYIGDTVENGGTLVGTYTANESLEGAEYGDGHYFSFQIPAEFRNGLEQSIYIYGRTAEAANLLPLMPTVRYGFTPSAEGRLFFEETLMPMYTTCMGCHSNMSYDLSWFKLASPKPFTGTADDNDYINYVIEGPTHAVLNHCDGDKALEPCASIQQWWRLEFEAAAN